MGALDLNLLEMGQMVLVEQFVSSETISGTCYEVAEWARMRGGVAI